MAWPVLLCLILACASGARAVSEASRPAPADVDVWRHPGDARAVGHGTLVLLHGFLHKKEGQSENARYLASRGWTVVVPQLPYTMLSPNTEDRVRRVIEVVEWIRAGGLGPPGPIVLVGHSAGGLTGLLVASRIPVSAVVGWDAVLTAGRPGSRRVAITKEELQRISAPVLLLEALPQSCNNERDQGFDAAAMLQHPRAERLVLGEASHCDFMDPGIGACLCGLVCGAFPVGERRQQMLRITADWLDSLGLQT